jgi:hypothetical protein
MLAHSPLMVAQRDHNELLLHVCEFVCGLILFGYGGADTFVSQNRLCRSKTTPDSSKPVRSPLTGAQSDRNELLLDVCELVGDLVMVGHVAIANRHVSSCF